MKLIYPHMVHQFMKNKDRTNLSVEEETHLLDILDIAKHLQSDGNVNATYVESVFKDVESREFRKLKSLVDSIQQAIMEEYRGILLVTNSLQKAQKYLSGVAYVWAMTTKRSAMVDDTFNTLKLLHHVNNNPYATSQDEDSADRYKFFSLLCLNSFTPVMTANSKSTGAMAGLLTDRVVRFPDRFTILVSVVVADVPDFKDQEAINKIERQVASQTRSVYGDTVASYIAHNFTIVAFPFNTPKHREIQVFPED